MGFIGGAPFAWNLLSGQLQSGAFVRGLWYFFGIVIAAGVFAGTAGLGLGYIAGLLWEQLHRHRRRDRLARKTVADEAVVALASPQPAPEPITSLDFPHLKLVSNGVSELPGISGMRLQSVRFSAASIELQLGTVRAVVSGNPVVICGQRRFRFPDAGARDALCALIGDSVAHARLAGADTIEVGFASGCALVIQRSSLAVA